MRQGALVPSRPGSAAGMSRAVLWQDQILPFSLFVIRISFGFRHGHLDFDAIAVPEPIESLFISNLACTDFPLHWPSAIYFAKYIA
jgi:hypothetical protein